MYFNRDNSPNSGNLDWMMPGMDGLEVTQKVRRDLSANYVYIMLLTALNRPEDIVMGLDSGVDDYICKTFFMMRN